MRTRGVAAIFVVALALAAGCGDDPAPGDATAEPGRATDTDTDTAQATDTSGVTATTARPVVWPPTSTTAQGTDGSPTSTTTTGSTAPASTTTTAPLRTPTAADPLRVLIVGDSVGFDASPGIQAAFEATGVAAVVGRASPGVGLSTSSEIADWRSAWAAEVADVRPEVVVVMTGAPDVYNVRSQQVDIVRYRALADEAYDILSADGARIVVIGALPSDVLGALPADTVSDRTVRQMVNAVAAAAVADRGGTAAYVGLDDEFSDDAGRFSFYVPGPDGSLVLARKVDGLHVCPDGAAIVGEAAVAAAAGWWALPPVDVAYRSGPWRLDARYDDPPGACAADPAVLAGEVPPPPPPSEAARLASTSSTTVSSTTVSSTTGPTG